MVDAGKIQPGQIVCSNAGRDEGNAFIVIEVLDNQFVHLVNGKTRRMSNPKKKNIKHLKSLGHCSAIKNKLESRKKINDGEIKKTISSYKITDD